jgi:hypothetical protein
MVGLTLLPAVFVVFNWHQDGWWGAGPFGPVVVLVDLIYLNLASGKTIVDARGIRTTRLVGRRSWTWSEIESITVEVEKSKKSGNVTHLAVNSTDGRSRNLFVPWHHEAIPGASFDSTAQAIVNALAARRRSQTTRP